MSESTTATSNPKTVASPPGLPLEKLVPAGQVLPFVLVTVLFYLWGIPNNRNDVLIRQFMKSFAITRFRAGLVQSAFYLGYFLLALPAALLMRKLGYKAGFVIGPLLFGAGTFLFWPAAILGECGFFLFSLFVIASGLSFLETASNPFIAQLGPPETSEKRLNISHAFNPLGPISGVLIGTIFIFFGGRTQPAADSFAPSPAPL
jgi:FHS family L-fucose permease-like MFS transporter